MAGLRAYHPQPNTTGDDTAAANGILRLTPAESAHLVRSLRARVGEPIEAFNGTGKIWRGTVRDANPQALLIDVTETTHSPAPLPRLAIAQAIPKGGLMDDIVRAAVELDAAEIFPLQTARTEIHLDADRASSRIKRWETIAIEACKQSGNPHLPRIATPSSLKKWIETETHPTPANADTLRVIGSLEPDAVPLAQLETTPAARTAKRLLILIGPEGDLAPEEYALARNHGFHAVRFGPHVLRVPTAAHYALTALDQLRQRLATTHRFGLPI